MHVLHGLRLMVWMCTCCVASLGYSLSSITLLFFVLTEFCDSPLLYIIPCKGKSKIGAREAVSELLGSKGYRAVLTIKSRGSLANFACLKSICYPLVLCCIYVFCVMLRVML